MVFSGARRFGGLLARVWRVLLLSGLVFAALPVGSALADTTIGQVGASAPSAQNQYAGTCGPGVFADTTYVVPSSGGVINSFSFDSSPYSANDQRDFLVLRGSGGSYKVIGKTGLVTLLGIGLQTIPVNIPVQSGDILGFYQPGPSNTFHWDCNRSASDGGSISGGLSSDPNVGDTLSLPGAADSTTDLNESANLVIDPPSISEAFSPSQVPVDSQTTLTFTITNPNGGPLTGVAFTDTLPSGLVIPPPGITDNSAGSAECSAGPSFTDGTLKAIAGTNTISFTGGSIAGSSSCEFGLYINAGTAGDKDNSVTVSSSNGGTGNTANATLTVLAPLSIGTSQQPASATVGSSIADQATVSGGLNPSGTVTFNLYNNSSGTGPALFTDMENLVNGVATSAGYNTTATGTDYWVATYNGDSNNNSISSGVADEPVTVIKASPTIGTTQQPASATVGSSIADKATVSGGFTGMGTVCPPTCPSGTVTFNLYNNPNGTGTPLFTDTESLSGGTATSKGYKTTSSGTDYWVATYNGDSNNNSVTSGAASEPVAITITKTGSNSGGLTVKPGQIVIISPNATINGSVTVQAGGSLEIGSGAKINGGLTATTGLTATGAGTIEACGSTISGQVTITGDTGLVTFGDTGSCAGNKITGGVKITGGTGGVKFFHNTVSGSLTITGNQQPVTIGNNTVSGTQTTSPNP
jgi:uncharacterized repeat protein (TIGR01451 family)